jgi:hypothetical protein
VTWWNVFSSQILFSVTNPSPRGLVIFIMSPLSDTCNPHRAAYLYTSCLLVYSICEREMLHFKTPVCLLMPSYNYRLEDLDGHCNTSRYSPVGAFTLVQPVVRAKSVPRWADRACFHCSLSPLYRLDWISRVVSLCRYSQHDLSESGFCTVLAVRDGCHFAVVVLTVVGGCASSVWVCSVFVMAGVAICGVIFGVCVLLFRTIVAAFLAWAGVIMAICRARMSSALSINSSTVSGCYGWDVLGTC